MYKGFQDTYANEQYKGFPKLIHNMNNAAYGYSGLKYHLDAAYASSALWIDIISDNRWYGSVTKNASVVAFNNLPTVQFSASQSMSAAFPMALTKNMCVAFVYQKLANSGGNRNVVLHDGNDTLDNLRLRYLTSTMGIYSGDGTVLLSTVDDTNVHIAVMASGIGDASIIVDGVSKISTGIWESGNIAWNTLGWALGANSINGHIAEILIFDNKFFNTDCINLCNNINKKYAIY